MKVLVIGGTRYMGKILVQTLLDEGNDVSVLSRGNEKPSWWSNINHIKADRNNENELKKALQNFSFDWVFDFQAYRKEHVESFGNIMNGRVGKYLFVSTGSVYSKWDYGPSDEALLDFELNVPFSEDQVDWSDLSYEYDPNELEYGARKRHCEKWIIENKEVHLPNPGIRRKYFAMPPMNIEEARHQLDLIDHDFYFFREKESLSLQVIYKRNHGGYGVREAKD